MICCMVLPWLFSKFYLSSYYTAWYALLFSVVLFSVWLFSSLFFFFSFNCAMTRSTQSNFQPVKPNLGPFDFFFHPFAWWPPLSASAHPAMPRALGFSVSESVLSSSQPSCITSPPPHSMCAPLQVIDRPSTTVDSSSFLINSRPPRTPSQWVKFGSLLLWFPLQPWMFNVLDVSPFLRRICPILCLLTSLITHVHATLALPPPWSHWRMLLYRNE